MASSGTAPIAEIAQGYRISQTHLICLVNDLIRSSNIDSLRGRGIRLGKLPEGFTALSYGNRITN